MRGLELPRLHLGKRHGAEHALGGRCNLLGERSSLPRRAWDVHRGGAPAQSPSSAITFRSRAPSSRPFSDEPFSLEERSAWQITCAAALLVRTVHHSHIVPCTMQSRSNTRVTRMHAHSTKAHGTDAVSYLSLPRVDACALSKCGASPLGGHKLPLDAGFIAAIDCNLGHAWAMNEAKRRFGA